MPMAMPMIVDDAGRCPLLDEAIEMADGLFLPGSYSNMAPGRYGAAQHPDNQWLDETRDAVALAAIERAVALNLPLFAVCRGLQELNVAMGGTLHQSVRTVEGYDDHREDQAASLDAMYAPAHLVTPVAGSGFGAIVGQAGFRVNSLHAQGIDRLARGLVAEAHAEDGLIEAVRVAAHTGFALGVQWHPEWQYDQTPQSQALFKAFGAACGAYRARRQAALIHALIDVAVPVLQH